MGNTIFGRLTKYGRRIYGGYGEGVGKTTSTSTTYLPGIFTVVAYKPDGTKTAVYGSGSEKNALSKVTFELGDTGCGAFELTFKKLPTNAELDYNQRLDIMLFGDTKPWYSGYVITKPKTTTTETTYTFKGHGYYNLLDKYMVFGTWENVDPSEIVRAIALQLEQRFGIVYNGGKIINCGYTVTKIVLDGKSAKDTLKELSDFAVDYVYGVDEYRSLYFRPRVDEINEQARFVVGKHLNSYQPVWNTEKIVNWARIKGGQVSGGTQWLATVQDAASQAVYGLRMAVWSLPSAYTEADAARWGQNQINQYKAPIKSAKVTGVRLAYPLADGSFNVRRLSTQGQAAIIALDGTMDKYPITKLKYTVSPDKGIACDMTLGEPPFSADLYLKQIQRDAKNAEYLQSAATAQLS